MLSTVDSCPYSHNRVYSTYINIWIKRPSQEKKICSFNKFLSYGSVWFIIIHLSLNFRHLFNGCHRCPSSTVSSSWTQNHRSRLRESSLEAFFLHHHLLISRAGILLPTSSKSWYSIVIWILIIFNKNATFFTNWTNLTFSAQDKLSTGVHASISKHVSNLHLIFFQSQDDEATKRLRAMSKLFTLYTLYTTMLILGRYSHECVPYPLHIWTVSGLIWAITTDQQDRVTVLEANFQILLMSHVNATSFNLSHLIVTNQMHHVIDGIYEIKKLNLLQLSLIPSDILNTILCQHSIL